MNRGRYREDIVQGLENAPRAFIGLLQGENIGKRVVQVAADPTRNVVQAGVPVPHKEENR